MGVGRVFDVQDENAGRGRDFGVLRVHVDEEVVLAIDLTLDTGAGFRGAGFVYPVLTDRG